jgi:hypothetical protein
MNETPSGSDRERLLQQSFDREAADLDLRLEPAGGAETRAVGAAICLNGFISYDLISGKRPPGPADDQQIKSLIRGLESLPWAELPRRWREFLHDPYILVTSKGVLKSDQEVVDHWLASRELQEFLQEYPPHAPRKVKITQIKIVYIGSDRASATFRVQERFTNDKTLAANMTMIFVHLEHEGWRILVMTKGGRQEVWGNL